MSALDRAQSAANAESTPSVAVVRRAAGVIGAAQEHGATTPASIATALDAAGLLQGPETVAEAERLKARIAELEADRGLVSEYRLPFGRHHQYSWVIVRPYNHHRPDICDRSRWAVHLYQHGAAWQHVWTPRGWQPTGGMAEAEQYCWPDAATALAEARKVGTGPAAPGAGEG